MLCCRFVALRGRADGRQHWCAEEGDKPIRGVIRTDGLGHSLLGLINCMMISKALAPTCGPLVSSCGPQLAPGRVSARGFEPCRRRARDGRLDALLLGYVCRLRSLWVYCFLVKMVKLMVEVAKT